MSHLSKTDSARGNGFLGILTSIFSAGNAFVYCSSRSLHGLAVDGHAPKIFLRRNRNGVPVVAVLAVLVCGLLAFMQVNHGANIVLNWCVLLSNQLD